MPNDPNDRRDDDDAPEYTARERCGDVDREEVERFLVEDEDRAPLSGFLSW